ncbi:hypothetical protein ABFX02_03G104000 [Erythranthe guttata]
MPFGTLAANVLASCVMAALATLKKAVIITENIINPSKITWFYFILHKSHRVPFPFSFCRLERRIWATRVFKYSFYLRR